MDFNSPLVVAVAVVVLLTLIIIGGMILGYLGSSHISTGTHRYIAKPSRKKIKCKAADLNK